ncbi:MAG: glycosyltransferase family 9 protein [Candidatus Baltobacteraceae bacterium]
MSARALLYCAGGGIGDSLIASVVARALHGRYERVDALTLPGHEETLARVPDIDSVLVDRGQSESDLAAQLRAAGYEAAIVTWATARTARVAKLAAIPVRVGQTRRLYSNSFTHKVCVRSETGDVITHWSQILLDYARAIGCDTADAQPHFISTPADEGQADRLLASTRRDFALVHPTCAISPRRPVWPLDGWVDLVRRLQVRFNIPVLISGGPDDLPLLQPLLNATGAFSIVGKTSIGGFAAVAKRARAFVVMHSGPMHVAAAVGAPTIGVFPLQADFPDRWAPVGARVQVVRSSYCCRPGELMETCPDYACIQGLPVPRILAAVEALVVA